jgi:predicted phosphodiesterase
VRRIGLIGDVHTEAVRLRSAITFLRTLGVDSLVCTGDVPDGPGTPADVERCCALLRDAGVLTISGNHDRWLQDDEMRDLQGATPREEIAKRTLDYLAALPVTIELTTPLGLVLLCHGLGDDDMAQVQAHERGKELGDNEALQALLASNRYKVVINGHTHRAGVIELEGLTLVNAGTLRRDRSPCCSVVDFERAEVVFFDLTDEGATERARAALTRS